MSDAASAGDGLDPRLLALLVCPVTRGPLIWRPEDRLLVSEAAGLAFRVEAGVPIMLPEEALAWPLQEGALDRPAARS